VNAFFHRLRRWDLILTAALALPMSSRWRWLPAIGAHLGDGPLWFVLSAILLVWGVKSVRGITLIALIAVLASTGVSTVIKYIVRRRRPQELTAFYTVKHDRYSFPSGHATRMGAIAVVVGHFVPTLAPISYALAAIVAVCRVIVGVHYVSDVAIGLLIGVSGAISMLMVL
jgi:undecaprenyl-diphosphatase